MTKITRSGRPYDGDNLEIIANLTPSTNDPHVLLAVADWHDRRRGLRHVTIAQALWSASTGDRLAA